MDALSVFALAAQCTLSSPVNITAAVALHESGGNIYAVKVNNEPVETGSLDAGIAAVMEAIVADEFVTFGIGMVSNQDVEQSGVSVKDGFSPCLNLKILSERIAEKRREATGKGDERWLKAASLFGTGIDVGDVATSYISEIQKIRAGFKGMSGTTALAHQTSNTEQKPIASTQPVTVKKSDVSSINKWDVFNVTRGQSVLVYQGTKTQ